MPNAKRYPIAKSLKQMSALVGIEPRRVLRRAGLSPDFLDNEGRGVTASEYFAVWQASFDEVDDPKFSLDAAQRFAGSPYLPAILAFSCSPNTEIGLARLALFKPLVGPVKLDVTRANGCVQVRIGSTDQDAPMPPAACAFEAVYFLECARKFTGFRIVPMQVGLPELAGQHEDYASYFGVPVGTSAIATMSLSIEDAQRPLISENQDFWQWLEIDLKRQLAEVDANISVADRVRSTLVEILPSGQSSAEAVCKRLGMSKRSLQRKLKDEDATFQSILYATRSELSLKYLSKGDLNIEEVSYLLAYRDPNSFYRAFHAWTGMTPAEAKGRALQ